MAKKQGKIPKSKSVSGKAAKPQKERAAEQLPATPSGPPPAQPEGRTVGHAKKTGKRGPMPLDPVDDFNQPTQGEPLFPEKETAAPARKPRQPRLPQMEDAEIEEIEGSAENYADIRDQRMELTKEETRLKTELLGLMKKYGKTSYVHDGYDVKVIVESEKLKVRIKKEE